MTFSIEGQPKRRVRLARRWKPSDPPLGIPRMSPTKAQKLIERGRVSGNERFEKFQNSLQNSSIMVEGPTVGVFRDS